MDVAQYSVGQLSLEDARLRLGENSDGNDVEGYVRTGRIGRIQRGAVTSSHERELRRPAVEGVLAYDFFREFEIPRFTRLKHGNCSMLNHHQPSNFSKKAANHSVCCQQSVDQTRGDQMTPSHRSGRTTRCPCQLSSGLCQSKQCRETLAGSRWAIVPYLPVVLRLSVAPPQVDVCIPRSGGDSQRGLWAM